MKGCKECGKRLPQRNNQVNFACQALGYCRYCYRMYFPVRRWKRRTEGRKELKLPLSRDDRIWHIEHGFEGMEQIYWSKDFLAEWREYIEALKRGELKW